MTAKHQTLRLFPTPVVLGEIENAETLNAELEAAITARMEADPGVRRSNLGGWHSKPDFAAWAGAAGQALIGQAVGLANANTANAQGQDVALRWRVEAWANVSGSGHSNASHIHGGAYWSGVYYVRAEGGESGHLLLHDPRMPGLRMHAPGLRLKNSGPELVARIQPRAGQLVLFPSWLSHSVEPWDGDGARISIALNLSAPAPRAIAQTQPIETSKDKS